MKNQRYSLLTTIIVSALHPNEPQQAGTKWEPTNAIDIGEANELVQIGYAEKIDANKDDVLTLTVLQRQDEAKRKAAAEADEELADPLADNTLTGGLTDEELALILEGNIDQVKAELDGLTAAQLHRLDELEGDKEQGGKQRKGVHDAIADAIAALDDGQE